jgi:acetyl esterase/lipase
LRRWAIRDAGLPQSGCGWCISSWVDMEATGETMVSKSTVDPTVQKAGILDMARLYLNAADPRSPLAAPIYADLTGLAPLLIVGAAETLLDDAIRLARVAGAADVRADLQIWPEMIPIALCARRAAKRLSESTGLEAKTIPSSAGNRSQDWHVPAQRGRAPRL